jgi:transcriptional regulator with XRE-family HTH domain
MVRPRTKKVQPTEEPPGGMAETDGVIDVNAVVSYNLKAIRERWGWTQQNVADRLSRFTNHVLPQASISAMERGFDGERRRRFDAHELYLLAVVFSVPIAYFFLPPPGSLASRLADTDVPVAELYRWLLGGPGQLDVIDERMSELRIKNPDTLDPVTAAIFGTEGVAENWHDHFRTWRKNRVALLAREYGDQLEDVAKFLAEFSGKILALSPNGYLQEQAHRKGEKPFIGPGNPEA